MKTYLNVPYSEKDDAKKLGARWDAAKKSWYVENVDDMCVFSKWIASHGNGVVKITEQWIHDHSSRRGGWSKAQLALIGVSWPPVSGWVRRVSGNALSVSDALAFEAFNGGQKNRVVVGANYYDCKCDCGVPPWEVCKHSFPEYRAVPK